MRKTIFLVVVLPLLVASCTGNNRVEYLDQGRLCVYASPPTSPFDQNSQEFVADAPIHVMVTHHGCLSSSCTADRESSCTMAVQGQAITVSSQGGYTDTSGAPFGGCTDDCAVVAGTCQTAALPAGTYTLSHGDDSLTLTIPSTADMPPCVGQSD